MSDFQVTVKEVDNVVVLATDGYLNNIGGEKISEICDEYLDKGKNMFLINLEKSTVVNSIGVCLLYTSPSPRDMRRSRMPSSA